jgi:hypothetical protein
MIGAGKGGTTVVIDERFDGRATRGRAIIRRTGLGVCVCVCGGSENLAHGPAEPLAGI